MSFTLDPATAISDPHGISWGMHPITWRNDDIPEVGAFNTLEDMLLDLANTGYAGTECAGFFPPKEEVKAAAEARGIKIVAQWFSSFILRDGVEAVIHCAGNPKDARRVDVEGTRRLIDALDGRRVAPGPAGSPHRERRDGRGVDAARQERPDGDVGAHVLSYGILQRLRNPVKELLLFTLLYLLNREAGLEVALGDNLFAWTKGNSAAGFNAANIRVEGFWLRDVLQVDVVLNGASVKVEL